MAELWTDWELLFARCATDETFRNGLGEALRHGTDSEVLNLLEGIGVAGHTPAERSARVAALKNAFGPLSSVASVFGNKDVAGP